MKWLKKEQSHRRKNEKKLEMECFGLMMANGGDDDDDGVVVAVFCALLCI